MSNIKRKIPECLKEYVAGKQNFRCANNLEVNIE